MNTPLGPNYFPFNKFCARPTESNRDLRHPPPVPGQGPFREPCFVYCNQDNFVLPSFSQQHSFLRNNQQFPFTPQKQQVRNFSSFSGNSRGTPRNNFHNNYRNCNRTANNRFGDFRNCNRRNPVQMFPEGMVTTTTASATLTTNTGLGTTINSGPTITAQVEMNYYFPQNSGKMSKRDEHSKNYSASEVNRMKTVPVKNASKSNLVSNQHPGPENTIINNIKNFVNGLINPHMRNFSGCEQNKYYNSQYRNNNFGKERKRNDSYSSTQSSNTSRDECSRRKPNSQSKTDMNSLLENRSYHPCNSVKTDRNFSSNNVKRNNFKKEFSRNDKIPFSSVDNKCSPSHYSDYVDPKMESEIVAIFSKDDFPELPMPKRKIYKDSQQNAKSQSSAVANNNLNGISMGNLGTSLAASSAIEINKKCSTNKKKKQRTRKGLDYSIEDSFVILPSNSASNPSKLETSPIKSTCTKPSSTISSASPKMSNINLEQNIDRSVNMGNVISLGSLSTSPISLNSTPSAAAMLSSPVKVATSIFTQCLNSQPSNSNDEINKENFVNFLKIGSPPTFSCNRQRQLSECSDDSFIICFTDDAEDGIHYKYSDTTDDEDETVTDDDDVITEEEDEISENENYSDDEYDDNCFEISELLKESKLIIKSRNKTCYQNPKTKSDLTKGAKAEKTSVENEKKTVSPSTITDDPNGLDQLDSGFEERKERKVRFDLNPKIHIMHTWDYAYRAARKGDWEDFARDRLRFKHRVENLGNILNPVLEQKHREKIYNARFCDNLSSS